MSEHDQLNCKALLGSLSDYVDGSLSDELCREIDRHLSEDTLHRTVSLYHKSAEDAEVPGAVRERLFRVLNLEDYLQR